MRKKKEGRGRLAEAGNGTGNAAESRASGGNHKSSQFDRSEGKRDGRRGRGEIERAASYSYSVGTLV